MAAAAEAKIRTIDRFLSKFKEYQTIFDSKQHAWELPEPKKLGWRQKRVVKGLNRKFQKANREPFDQRGLA